MITIHIPGRKELTLRELALDFNGTIALDGQISGNTAELIDRLAQQLDVYILTADTFATASAQCTNLPVTLHILRSASHTEEKGAFVRHLGGEHVVSIGNGQNDVEMLRSSALGIGVIGEEGCAASILQAADLMVPSIQRALELLLYPKRLIATLRK